MSVSGSRRDLEIDEPQGLARGDDLNPAAIANDGLLAGLPPEAFVLQNDFPAGRLDDLGALREDLPVFVGVLPVVAAR